MKFKDILRQQIVNHPSMMPQDVAKLCFQATYGAEHLLEDVKRAEAFFYDEYQMTEPGDKPVCEAISEEIVRVNFAGWKQSGLDEKKLFKAFCESAREISGATQKRDDEFRQRTEIVHEVLQEAERDDYVKLDFSIDDWKEYLEQYRQGGIRPVHHSSRYREAEKPAYRIVKKEILLKYLKV